MTLISWTVSYTLVAWSIKMVSHVKKSYGWLAWPIESWTHSAQICGFVCTCANRQRLEGSSQKQILLFGLFLKWIIQGGGGQGGAHKVRGWGKSMLPAESYLVWKGGLHGDLHGVIGGAGVRELARWLAPRRMPPMIDSFIHEVTGRLKSRKTMLSIELLISIIWYIIFNR